MERTDGAYGEARCLAERRDLAAHWCAAVGRAAVGCVVEIEPQQDPGAAGAVGAALTVGLKRGGLLLALLILPLYIPVLIFGAGAVDATVTGLGAQAHLSLLAALTLAGVFFAPWPTAAALRIALE